MRASDHVRRRPSVLGKRVTIRGNNCEEVRVSVRVSESEVNIYIYISSIERGEG